MPWRLLIASANSLPRWRRPPRSICTTSSITAGSCEHDPIPGRYTLEVSSPGLERPLRTPEHFRRAAGSEVRVKTLAGFDGPRRLTGILEGVADDGVDLRSTDGEVCRIAYEQLASARTVFEWGSRPHRDQPR